MVGLDYDQIMTWKKKYFCVVLNLDNDINIAMAISGRL